MLQWRQDTIRYCCNGECDNGGVHKGSLFMVIVTLSSHSSLFYILCSLLPSWQSSFRYAWL